MTSDSRIEKGRMSMTIKIQENLQVEFLGEKDGSSLSAQEKDAKVSMVVGMLFPQLKKP